MGEFNWKHVALLVATVFVTWLATKGTDIISTGVEGTIADNPEIVSLKSDMKQLEQEFDDYKVETSAIHAKAAAEIEAVIRSTDQTVDQLNNVVGLLRGDG